MKTRNKKHSFLNKLIRMKYLRDQKTKDLVSNFNNLKLNQVKKFVNKCKMMNHLEMNSL